MKNQRSQAPKSVGIPLLGSRHSGGYSASAHGFSPKQETRTHNNTNVHYYVELYHSFSVLSTRRRPFKQKRLFFPAKINGVKGKTGNRRHGRQKTSNNEKVSVDTGCFFPVQNTPEIPDGTVLFRQSYGAPYRDISQSIGSRFSQEKGEPQSTAPCKKR